VLRRFKNLVRRYVPRRQHPLLDGAVTTFPRDDEFARAYEPLAVGSDDFVRMRFEEGRRWRNVVRHLRPERSLDVLDVGGGNGAVELAFSADPRMRVASAEISWNDDVRTLYDRARLPQRRTVASGALLPFRRDTFDVVICLETVEHLREPATVAAEIARVTRAGGLLLLTTPPRWRYLLAPDPHFGIRGLVALTAGMQRRVAERRGFSGPHHYVDRLYRSVDELLGLFKDFEMESVLSRSRAPGRWFWDAVALRRRS
jgi:SAM-dependent methyltransferase